MAPTLSNYEQGPCQHNSLFFQILQRKRSAKEKIERKISVSSIMSEESFSTEHYLEEAGQAIGAAVGLSKGGSIVPSRNITFIIRGDVGVLQGVQLHNRIFGHSSFENQKTVNEFHERLQ